MAAVPDPGFELFRQILAAKHTVLRFSGRGLRLPVPATPLVISRKKTRPEEGKRATRAPRRKSSVGSGGREHHLGEAISPFRDARTRRAPIPTDMCRTDTALAVLRERTRACLRCPRSHWRTMAVFGEGSLSPDLLIIGGQPAPADDLCGRPFSKEEGALLRRMVEGGMLWSMDRVFLCYALKCFRAESEPKPDEIASCRTILDEQISLLRPRALCAAGEVAVKALLGPNASVEGSRDRWFDFGGIPLRVTFSPAFLLRCPPRSVKSFKRKAWVDLKALAARLRPL